MSTNPSTPLLLASASPSRKALLASAGLDVTYSPARLDEAALRASMHAEGLSPRDQSDALAEAKALRLVGKYPDHIVLGCDQVIDIDVISMGKPECRDEAAARLQLLQGRSHKLHTAIVAVQDQQPVWRHIETATLTMHPLSPEQISVHLDHTWPMVAGSSGAYHVEGRGVRLFSRIQGDWSSIIGLPLIALLSWLHIRGIVQP